ncbi:hypothetical protein [Nonomuraea sp. KM90]|uniref:hypothetical protein n=1 Tax=Nonomuraea sp. KM90 TaxID=3457428 RepID=UPI003FCD1D40
MVGVGEPGALLGERRRGPAVRVENGLITGLYAVRNPEELSHLRRETALTR